MLFSKVVVVVSFLVTILFIVSARPRPGVTRVRHIIHAPIKFRIIHHYKIKKIPIIVKKHVHYLSSHPKELPLEEGHSNDIQFEHLDEEGGRHRHIHHFHGDHHEEEQLEEDDDDDDVHGYRNPTSFYHGINHDYDEVHQQQSQEADYEDYEYE